MVPEAAKKSILQFPCNEREFRELKPLVTFKRVWMDPLLFSTRLIPAMVIFLKGISQKTNSTKNDLRGPNLFLQEHLHYLRRRWFDL
jgi:hypothetical protein